MRTIHPSRTNLICAAQTRSRRLELLAAVITSLALVATGCGSSAPGSPNTGSPASFTAAAFSYSNCMRDHGLPSYPDPAMTDHDGQQVAFLAVTIPADPSPAFKRAENACRGILPPPSTTDPTQLAAQRSARERHILAFADACAVTGSPTSRSHQPGTAHPRDDRRRRDRRARAGRPHRRHGLPDMSGGAITAADVQRGLTSAQVRARRCNSLRWGWWISSSARRPSRCVSNCWSSWPSTLSGGGGLRAADGAVGRSPLPSAGDGGAQGAGPAARPVEAVSRTRPSGVVA